MQVMCGETNVDHSLMMDFNFNFFFSLSLSLPVYYLANDSRHNWSPLDLYSAGWLRPFSS